MSDFTMNLRNIENMKNDRERIKVSNFYVTNYLRENDCCIPSEDWKTILFYDYDPWCLIYEVVEHWTPEKERKIAKVWWSEFEKVNTDDYDQTTEPFMFWPEGTDQFDIMEAFKDFFNIDVIEDKEFMGMTGFANGDVLLNKEQEKNDMKETKETTIYFINGEMADVFRHGDNDYSIYFYNRDYSVRGSWLSVVNEIEKHKSKQTNEYDSTAMTSCGRYMNLWTTDGVYDCYVKFHEAEDNDKVDRAIEATESVCHDIMQNKYMKTEEKRKLIDNLLDTYTEYGVGVIIVKDETQKGAK